MPTTELPQPDEASYPDDPPEECDLVMKGGLTSGIVYPPAIQELQKKYRLRSIGGTSAGAIAAALAGAAEYGRAEGGFEKLRHKAAELKQDRFLLDLLQAAPEFRQLSDTLIDLFLVQAEELQTARAPATEPTPQGSNFSRVVHWLRRIQKALGRTMRAEVQRGSFLGALGGFATGLAAGSFLELAHLPWDGWSLIVIAFLAMIAAVVGFLVGGLFVPIRALGAAVQKLPSTGGFGLSKGYDAADSRLLTTWLGDAIDELAGRGAKPQGDPLTFEDLDTRRVHLRMMTSNLSQRRPYVLPLEQSYDDLFLFKVDELGTYFPPRVVRYLENATRKSDFKLPQGYHFLPQGRKLPVIFATRLSLSFPILLSAVPLYTIRRSAFAEKKEAEAAGAAFQWDPEKHLQKHWFSDGGISSNFPIHFFDCWLPTRPLFGINLLDLPKGAKQAGGVTADYFSSAASDEKVRVFEDVHLPKPNEFKASLPPWTPIPTLGSFFGAIFTTAQNYRDNLQAALPSYRERIARLYLEEGEGGLSLTMDKEKIESMERKGSLAGEKLSGLEFQHHQWVRLLVLMAELESELPQVLAALPDGGAARRLFATARNQKFYKSSDWNDSRVTQGVAQVEGLLALAHAWQKVGVFQKDAPKPETVLRVTPPV